LAALTRRAILNLQSKILNPLEESPHSTEHGAGETPERGNLLDRATETNRRWLPLGRSGKGEKASQALTGAGSNIGGQVTPARSKAKQERRNC
jgi:hypothetical protein